MLLSRLPRGVWVGLGIGLLLCLLFPKSRALLADVAKSLGGAATKVMELGMMTMVHCDRERQLAA